MLPENHSAIVTRNEKWSGHAATEPYEAGWAREAVFFVRALDTPKGPSGSAAVQISADGMNWVAEGTTLDLPGARDAVSVARVRHFGNWLRLAANLAPGAECCALVTLHLKA